MYRAVAIKIWYHTWYLPKALHLGHRDRCFLNSWQRKETSQTSDSTVMQWGLFVTRGPTPPITPASSECLRPDGPCFRKEEPYQHSAAMFSTLGRTQEENKKWWGGGIRAPQNEVTRLIASQAISQEDRGGGHQSLKLGPASLVLTQHVILSSSESQPPWIKKEIRTRSLTWEQLMLEK